jgi:STAS domain
MTRTRFCDSAGLHALIGAHRRARTEGRQVRLAVTGPQVHRLIALAALDRRSPVYPSLDQVLAHLPVAPSRAARDQGRQQQARPPGRWPDQACRAWLRPPDPAAVRDCAALAVVAGIRAYQAHSNAYVTFRICRGQPGARSGAVA